MTIATDSSGDFLSVLSKHAPSYLASTAAFARATRSLAPVAASGLYEPLIESTTILAFKFAHGVLVAGDRRATAGNTVVYERADKVIEIDERSIMAIAGVPATAWEMARILEHSFQFYRRSQLQEMSVEGKVRTLSKLLRDNLGMVLQGVGAVSPLFATHDGATGRIYFYDTLGAQFEAVDFTTTGSGAPAVRSVLHYVNRWSGRSLCTLGREESLLLALRALETAALSDTATGGIDHRHSVFPIIKLITAGGIETITAQELQDLFEGEVA